MAMKKFATIGNFRRTKNSQIQWDSAATFRPTTVLLNYFYVDDAIVSEFNPCRMMPFFVTAVAFHTMLNSLIPIYIDGIPVKKLLK